MAPLAAFALGASTSSFTASRTPKSTPLCAKRAPRHYVVAMADEKKGIFQNPFAKKPKSDDAPTTFMEPQAGDPGYKAPKPSNLPVFSDSKVKGTLKRGLKLLKEDLLKNAPERAGVGRQDTEGVTMKPVAGEPGYKPPAFQTVKVSELGISPFPDDANAVGKVGGVSAVKKAATDVVAGKSAKQIKDTLLREATNAAPPPAPEVFDIPDYLKPIPEDTPGKRQTWKNFQGR